MVHFSLCAAPVLNVGTPDVFTSASQPTTLICEASGTPAPTVSWTRNEEPLDKERFIQLADGSLFINDTDLQDEGTYTVAASNSVGEEASRVKLIVTKPTPPDSKRKINLIQHSHSSYIVCTLMVGPNLQHLPHNIFMLINILLFSCNLLYIIIIKRDMDLPGLHPPTLNVVDIQNHIWEEADKHHLNSECDVYRKYL